MRIKYKWVGWGMGREHDWDTPPWMVWRSTNAEVLHIVQVDPRKFWPNGFPPRTIRIDPVASGLVQ